METIKPDVFVRYETGLPDSIPAVVAETADGDYQALINPIYSHEAQIEALRHELVHVKRDYGKKDDVAEIENSAHNKTAGQ